MMVSYKKFLVAGLMTAMVGSAHAWKTLQTKVEQLPKLTIDLNVDILDQVKSFKDNVTPATNKLVAAGFMSNMSEDLKNLFANPAVKVYIKANGAEALQNELIELLQKPNAKKGQVDQAVVDAAIEQVKAGIKTIVEEIQLADDNAKIALDKQAKREERKVAKAAAAAAEEAKLAEEEAKTVTSFEGADLLKTPKSLLSGIKYAVTVPVLGAWALTKGTASHLYNNKGTYLSAAALTAAYCMYQKYMNPEADFSDYTGINSVLNSNVATGISNVFSGAKDYVSSFFSTKTTPVAFDQCSADFKDTCSVSEDFLTKSPYEGQFVHAGYDETVVNLVPFGPENAPVVDHAANEAFFKAVNPGFSTPVESVCDAGLFVKAAPVDHAANEAFFKAVNPGFSTPVESVCDAGLFVKAAPVDHAANEEFFKAVNPKLSTPVESVCDAGLFVKAAKKAAKVAKKATKVVAENVVANVPQAPSFWANVGKSVVSAATFGYYQGK